MKTHVVVMETHTIGTAAEPSNETKFRCDKGSSTATLSRTECDSRALKNSKVPLLHPFEEPFVINIKREEDN